MDKKKLLSELVKLRDATEDECWRDRLENLTDELHLDIQCDEDDAEFKNDYECEKLGKKEYGL